MDGLAKTEERDWAGRKENGKVKDWEGKKESFAERVEEVWAGRELLH